MTPSASGIQSTSTSQLTLTDLRKSLQYWQDLELDYHGLKDEFLSLGSPASASRAECLALARAFGAVVVGDEELSELVGSRSPGQIVGVLEGRIGDVSLAVEELRERIAVLEGQGRGDGEEEGEEMLPVREIVEELDEEGNVIEGRVGVPGQELAGVVAVQDGSGLDGEAARRGRTVDGTTRLGSATATATDPAVRGLPVRAKLQSTSGTDTDPTTIPADANPAEVLAIIDAASKDEAISQLSSPLLEPTNQTDTEEEARLRQEMLQYNLDDVSNIVAELEIAEGEIDDASDIDLLSDEFEDDEEDPSLDFHEDTEDDSEDERGMSRRPLSDEYKQRMQALEKELGMELKNVGPVETIADKLKGYVAKPPAAEAARQAAIRRYEEAMVKTDGSGDTSMPLTKKKAKKKVAFSPELDVVSKQSVGVEKVTDELATTAARRPTATHSVPATSDVIERETTTTTTKSSVSQPSTPTPIKTSRFKAARQSTPQTPLLPPPMDFPTTRKPPPTGPTDKLVAETLVERPSSKRPSAPDPDGFDEELQKRQIALEHHAIRNKIIHEQGGYVRGGELDNFGDEYVAPEIVDEDTGRVRKLSRFKAARTQR